MAKWLIDYVSENNTRIAFAYFLMFTVPILSVLATWYIIK